MKDPYKVLGVSPNASDEEIKSAYRELAKKYHPDKYAGSDLADLAEEKMKEVNEAYDMIQKLRSGNNGHRTNSYESNFGAGGTGNGRFAEVRRALNNHDLDLAETLLNQVSEPERDAEWYFLTGCVAYNKGYFADAQRFFDIACDMDPSCPEYRNARNIMRRRTAGYGGGYTTTTGGGCSSCDICSGLMCADCCCECMGGDCISCC